MKEFNLVFIMCEIMVTKDLSSPTLKMKMADMCILSLSFLLPPSSLSLFVVCVHNFANMSNDLLFPVLKIMLQHMNKEILQFLFLKPSNDIFLLFPFDNIHCKEGI